MGTLLKKLCGSFDCRMVDDCDKCPLEFAMNEGHAQDVFRKWKEPVDEVATLTAKVDALAEQLDALKKRMTIDPSQIRFDGRWNLDR